MQIFPQTNYIKCFNAVETYRMSYTAWGKQVPGGKTLICVHGLNRNSRDWDFVAMHFVKLGYYVVAPDIVGHGNSDYLTNWVGYTVPAYVNDILLMIKTLQLENIEYIGTSMGGLIGMSIAGLPLNPILRLVLNDIGAEIELKGLKRINEYKVIQRDFATFEEARQYLLSISQGFAVPPELEDFYTMTSFQKNSLGRYELKRDLNISRANKLTPLINNIELWEFWKKINLSTLIIHGADSDILSEQTVKKMQEINPNTQGVTLPNVGHAPYLCSPAHMQMLQEFLI